MRQTIDKKKLSPDLLAALRRMEIKMRRRQNNLFSGQSKSTHVGQGLELKELREYVIGDDVRRIDWNVTARLGHPQVKIYQEDREQRVFIVLDKSLSLNFGAETRRKIDTACEAATLLAHYCFYAGAQAGICTFSTEINQFLPYAKGRAQLSRMLDVIFSDFKNTIGPTPIDDILKKLSLRLQKPAQVFIISDFLSDQDYTRSLKIISSRHDVKLIRVVDSREVNFKGVGLVRLYDQETASTLPVFLNDKYKLKFQTLAHKDFSISENSSPLTLLQLIMGS